jgi:hypothetical protein
MVIHNLPGYEWDKWNRAMRKLAVDSQVKEAKDCANGSWFNADDASAAAGGRLFQTSLNALTLEIYYRYLPLHKSEGETAAH